MCVCVAMSSPARKEIEMFDCSPDSGLRSVIIDVGVVLLVVSRLGGWVGCTICSGL